MESYFDEMMNSFKEELKHLNKKFSPQKTYKILKNNENGKLIKYPLYDESFICKSGNNYFEIKYNKKILIKEHFDESRYNLEELKDLFYYFARHEFGHSQLRKINHILNEIEFPNRSIKRHCYTLLGTFKEFYADYFVNKYFDEVPQKYIQNWVKCLSVDRELFKSLEFIDDITKYLWCNLYIAERFFIFNKWDLLRDFYQSNNLDLLYELLFKIFEKFREICSDPIDLILLRKELFKLAKELDDIDYKKLLKIVT
ncbi:MAG: hypothetical protein ACFFDN_16465 [Candidatus Hodarchaeota archaeon]